MKTFYSIENHFENCRYCIRKWFCAAIFWSCCKSGINGFFMNFSQAVHNWEQFNLSISLMFRSNVLRQLIFTWLIFSMDGMCSFWICFRFWVRKTSFCQELRDVIFLKIKAKLFAALYLVTTRKYLWSAARYDMTLGSHNIGFWVWVVFSF